MAAPLSTRLAHSALRQGSTPPGLPKCRTARNAHVVGRMGRRLAVPLAGSWDASRCEYGRIPFVGPGAGTAPGPVGEPRRSLVASWLPPGGHYGLPQASLPPTFTGTPQRFRLRFRLRFRILPSEDPAPGPCPHRAHPPTTFRFVSRLAHRACEPRHLTLDGTRASRLPGRRPAQRPTSLPSLLARGSQVGDARADPPRRYGGATLFRDGGAATGHSASAVRPKRAIQSLGSGAKTTLKSTPAVPGSGRPLDDVEIAATTWERSSICNTTLPFPPPPFAMRCPGIQVVDATEH